jgi:hypothetical protein
LSRLNSYRRIDSCHNLELILFVLIDIYWFNFKERSTRKRKAMIVRSQDAGKRILIQAKIFGIVSNVNMIFVMIA